MPPSLRWDVFCRIVDNFGDAGVVLAPRAPARARARHRGDAVDRRRREPRALVPGARCRWRRPGRTRAFACDAVVGWSPTTSTLPDVVVEASAAACPSPTSTRWRARPRPPVWVVLEYLSAEPWIDASHALPSPHPQLPLTRWFWFPGFTREDRRPAARSAACSRSATRFARDARRARCDVARAGLSRRPPGCVERLAVLLRESGAARAARRVGGRRRAGRLHRARGRRALRARPLDRRRRPAPGRAAHARPAHARRRRRSSTRTRSTAGLWACDLNFVRGEDSFVRAQWAAQPFVWHIYPQAGATRT